MKKRRARNRGSNIWWVNAKQYCL